MQLFSLYSENNEWGYFHSKVIIILKNICNGVRTSISLTSIAQRSHNYATPADIF